jgi:hypothetical protein
VENLQVREKELLEENIILKEEISKLRYEYLAGNDENRTKIRKN